MLESKSLKLYLFSLEIIGAFHEDCVNVILNDLVELLQPRYIEVVGKFLPRGGISIDPCVQLRAAGNPVYGTRRFRSNIMI